MPHAQVFNRLADDRGDVPGWVLITLMTAGLVIVIWGSPAPRSARSSPTRSPKSPVCDRVRARVGGRRFVMVGAILTVLTVSVLQLALALHVRNTVLDAASEGHDSRRWQTTAPPTSHPVPHLINARDRRRLRAGHLGVDRQLARGSGRHGHGAYHAADVGLIGIAGGVEVSGHAVVETLD
jgi:hypothetical protein